MFLTPGSNPIGEGWADDALLLVRQRERSLLSVWQLLFCRLFNESAYRHLDLQFFNLRVCRNPTSPDEASPKHHALDFWLRIHYSI